MTQINKEILIKRTKSFLWRLGDVAAIAILNFGATQIELFDLPIWAVGIIGLILGEITKLLNAKKA